MAINRSSTGTLYCRTGILKKSTTFIWNTADSIGKGSFAEVFFGRHKVTGMVVAIKEFHTSNVQHWILASQREMAALTELKHRNIVQLFGFEAEEITGSRVLIMEYCAGGSVQTMLEKPEYAFGFPESEFMIFIGDIADGMEHLHIKGYIHRDIKPGNVLRAIQDDGRSVYKLTDFGSARKLGQDETFQSIYGTLEYLFPDMYRKVVMKQVSEGQYDARIDLWSIGVTFYHVATGQLPFQPYGGRSDQEIWHRMTSTKPKGMISGKQQQQDAQIIWSNQLTKTCRLSMTLQRQLVPVLARLMEVDPESMLKFKEFFFKIREIVKKILILIFCFSTGKKIFIYLKTTDTYAQLQEHIASATEIPPVEQLILFGDFEVSEVVESSAKIEDYPKILLQSLLYVFHRQPLDFVRLERGELPKFPDFTSNVDLDDDVKLGKKCSDVSFYIYTETVQIVERQEILVDGESKLRRHVHRRVKECQQLLPLLIKVIHETHKRLDTICMVATNVTEMIEVMLQTQAENNAFWELREETLDISLKLRGTEIKSFREKIEGRVTEIETYSSLLMQRIVEREQTVTAQCVVCSEVEHCSSKANNIKQKIVAVMDTFRRHKQYGSLHPHEEFIHRCERKKLQDLCSQLLSMTKHHCLGNLQTIFDVAVKETGLLTKHLLRAKKVEQNIRAVIESQELLSNNLEKFQDEFRRKTEELKRKLLELNKEMERTTGTTTSGDNPDQALDNVTRVGNTRTPNQIIQLNQELQMLRDDTLRLHDRILESTDILQRFLARAQDPGDSLEEKPGNS
ncbi:hypothetical protein CHS0354_004837 [Potamilus streckersoni]|uniref:Protein kinase domain-containing protein n=1 Tax=Potamilus streckersoni TaxID=2493646 RepID=A0AAE0VRP7_9BIVA|nr:hypothetical protein CHS0354_004837 [Potamilus streckersoni]